MDDQSNTNSNNTEKKGLPISEKISIILSIVAIVISVISLGVTKKQNEIGKKGTIPSVDVRVTYADELIDTISIVNRVKVPCYFTKI